MLGKYEKQVYLSMVAEECNRFEDMMNFLDIIIKNKEEPLTSDERNLLSIAYKNTISLRRTAIRTLLAYEEKERKKEDSVYLSYIIDYKKRIEKELEDMCEKMIKNIQESLLSKANDDESNVFYNKMKADYYRYIAENNESERKKLFAEKSLNSYEAAMEVAGNLNITNPIRLGLALNFSVFYYEVIGDNDKACNIAKDTISKASEPLSYIEVEDEKFKDAISIMDLLQENLQMWISENNE
jgi:14-3-3 protein epsilon